MNGASVPAPPAVLKFGGTTLERPARIASLLLAALRDNPRVLAVVSARAGVTDLLVRAADGQLGDRELLRRLRDRHPQIPFSVVTGLARAAGVSGRGAPRRARAPGPEREALLALGERLAVVWLAEELGRRGVRARALPADRAGLRVAGRGARRWIDLAHSKGPVGRALARAWARHELPLVTGFFGRDARGRPRTLGRGSSDYTAVALAALFGAPEVRLVKREGPVRTADPRYVREARVLPTLSFEGAKELAELGTRILHPSAIELAHRRGIELLVVELERPARTTRIARHPLRADRGPLLSFQEGLALWRGPPGARGAEWWGELAEELRRGPSELVLVGRSDGARTAVLRLLGRRASRTSGSGGSPRGGRTTPIALLTVRGARGRGRSSPPRLVDRPGVLGVWSDARSIIAAVRPNAGRRLLRELHRWALPPASRAPEELSGGR